jgi:hypothetical protein
MSPVLDCITVMTSSDEPRATRSRTRNSQALSSIPAVSQDEKSSSPAGRRSKNKRKRIDQSQESGSKKLRNRKYTDAEDVEPILDSQYERMALKDLPSSPDEPSGIGATRMSIVDGDDSFLGAGAMPSPGPDMLVLPASTTKRATAVTPLPSGSDTSDEVHLQILTEASQDEPQAEADVEELPTTDGAMMSETGAEQAALDGAVIGEEEPADAPVATHAAEVEQAPSVEASQVESIMGTLWGGIEQLRSAALSREEVYKIEDLLMDMKRELYAAESRGRRP